MPCMTCSDPARCDRFGVCQSFRFPLHRTDHVTSNDYIHSACEQSGEVVAMVGDGAEEDTIPRTVQCKQCLGIMNEGNGCTLPGCPIGATPFTPIGRFFLRDGQWVRAAPGSPVGETLYRRTGGVALPFDRDYVHAYLQEALADAVGGEVDPEVRRFMEWLRTDGVGEVQRG